MGREAVTIQAVGAGIVTYVMTEENARIASGDPIAVVQEQIRVCPPLPTTAIPETSISHRRVRWRRRWADSGKYTKALEIKCS